MGKAAETLGKRLKDILAAQGISQAELAARAGTTQAQISAYINQKGSPTLESAERLAGALGVSIAALIGDEPPVIAPPSTSPEERRLEAIGMILSSKADLSSDSLRALAAVLGASQNELKVLLSAAKPVLDRLAQGQKRSRSESA